MVRRRADVEDGVVQREEDAWRRGAVVEGEFGWGEEEGAFLYAKVRIVWLGPGKGISCLLFSAVEFGKGSQDRLVRGWRR